MAAARLPPGNLIQAGREQMSDGNQKSAILEPEEQVLSTLLRDGSRRWLKPKLSCGEHLKHRRVLAWILIAIFTLIPFIKIGGRPLVLLDIVARRFTILGFTFHPTDTVLLALFMVGLLLTVFLMTALLGRVWCGWACPQTVYMEFVFRPIERFFDGTMGRGGEPKKNRAGVWLVLRYLTYFAVCFYLANTFLAYFVGVDALIRWMTQSPINHPIPFLVMVAVTGAMMFDFCFFREQMCIVACPYGRFQSVLLDQNSLIVSYDETRGEPRGKAKKKDLPKLEQVGDCVDCGLCVTTCPTGIDIRNGLQMECINCTQCIDACNAVMKKVGRKPGLIRYSSQASMAGKHNSLLRARVIIYPLVLTIIASLFFVVLFNKQSFNAIVLREKGNPYTVISETEVQNLYTLKLTNRTRKDMEFDFEVISPEGVEIQVSENSLALTPEDTTTFHFSAIAPPELFKTGPKDLRLRVTNTQGVARNLKTRMLGPRNVPKSNASQETEADANSDPVDNDTSENNVDN